MIVLLLGRRASEICTKQLVKAEIYGHMITACESCDLAPRGHSSTDVRAAARALSTGATIARPTIVTTAAASGASISAAHLSAPRAPASWAAHDEFDLLTVEEQRQNFAVDFRVAWPAAPALGLHVVAQWHRRPTFADHDVVVVAEHQVIGVPRDVLLALPALAMRAHLEAARATNKVHVGHARDEARRARRVLVGADATDGAVGAGGARDHLCSTFTRINKKCGALPAVTPSLPPALWQLVRPSRAYWSAPPMAPCRPVSGRVLRARSFRISTRIVSRLDGDLHSLPMPDH